MDSFPGAASTRPGQGLVPLDLDHPADERGEHPGPAPRAHAGPHAGPGRGALRRTAHLNFAEHGAASAWGIGNEQALLARAHLHSTLAVSDEGLPLGVLRMEFDAPEGGARTRPRRAWRRRVGRRKTARERSRSERSGGERSRGERSGGEGSARGERPGAEGSGGEGPVPEGQFGYSARRALGARDARLRGGGRAAARHVGSGVGDGPQPSCSPSNGGWAGRPAGAGEAQPQPAADDRARNGREETPKLFDWLRDQPGQAQLAITWRACRRGSARATSRRACCGRRARPGDAALAGR